MAENENKPPVKWKKFLIKAPRKVIRDLQAMLSAKSFIRPTVLKDDLQKVTGNLSIEIRKQGELVQTVDGGNLVVDTGLGMLTQLLGGDNLSDNFISKMAWGDGGHDTGNPTVALPPTASDTALNNQLLQKPITSHDNPSGISVRFQATIDETELNGQLISEAALISNNLGIMFARRTFGALLKQNTFSFTFKWTIQF